MMRTLRHLFCVMILCVVYSLSNSNAQGPVITLSHGGSVRGVRESVTIDTGTKTVDYFLGIPFGKPPAGELRFAAPEKHSGWTGTIEANKLPYTCWQYIFSGFDLANSGARMWVNNTEMNEDCLYLNLWKPTNSRRKRLPVMVWVFGGGYTTGTANLDVYNGKFLSVKHDVIVVAMQYRLGAFGFLRIQPDLPTSRAGIHASSKLALGNMALKDQLLALEWIKQEIHQFDGDASKVTLFGESSGAVSVSALWVSPKARDYFSRVIVQSGSISTRWGLQDLDVAHHRALVFAKTCSCMNHTRDAMIKCLQDLEPLQVVNCLAGISEDIVAQRNRTVWNNFFTQMSKEQLGENAYPGWATSSGRYFDVPFSVVIDEDFIPMHPNEMMKNASLIKQAPEMLIGINRDESIYFLLYGLQMKDTSFLQSDGQVMLPETIRKAGMREPLWPGGELADFHWIITLQVLDQKYLLPGLTELPVQFYGLPFAPNSTYSFANPNELKLTSEELMKRINDLVSDMDFVCPVLDFADRVARIPDAKVFLYYFTQPSTQLPWPEWVGVMHGYEIHYVFGMPYSQEFTEQFFGFTAEEKLFGDQMQQLWVNFAKTGNPNKRDDGQTESIPWPRYKPSTQKVVNEMDHLILDKNMRPGSGLRNRECSFWLQLMENQRRIIEQLRSNSGFISLSKHVLFTLTAVWTAFLIRF